jgi:hypothetical protein
MGKRQNLPQEHVSEIVQMALSDHVGFADTEREYGIGENECEILEIGAPITNRLLSGLSNLLC